MKAIIIDDEKMARILLQEMIQENLKHIEIITSCSDLASGVLAIRKHKPDIVFLDIEMPGHSGLELLDFFEESEINFKIIFTTAYNQYAIEAFKMSAIDYILKPISVEELVQAVKKIDHASQSQNIQNLKHNFNQDAERKIAIPTLNSTRFVPIQNIVFLKASRAYTEIKLKDGEQLLVSRGLKKFESLLQNQNDFFRCHKSFIVNTRYIEEHVKSDGGYLILEGGQTEIPIASDKVKELYNRMDWVIKDV